VPGFVVATWTAAFLGALVLAVLHLLFGFLDGPKKKPV
jgi:putative membrane protein